ncbi:hypothetical protein Tco_0617385 [Tanacetum coccineum]
MVTIILENYSTSLSVFYNVNDKDDDNGDDDNSDDNDDGGNDDGGNKGNFEENPSFSLEDYEEEEKDKEDVAKELYGDLNITQGLRDTDMANVKQGTMQSSFVSSDFTSKLLNLDNTSPDVNEIASLMNTSTIPLSPPPVNPSSHLTITPQQQTPYSIKTTTNSTITLPEIPNFIKEAVDVVIRLQSNKLKKEAKAENLEFFKQVDSTMKKIIKEQVKAQVSKIMPQIKKYVTESLGAEVLVRSTNQPQTSYAVAASLLEFKLNKILIDKMETNKMINRSDIQNNLYNVLVEAYNSDKDIFSSYGDVVTLKRGQDDQDKDEDRSTGSDRGTKRRKSSKDAEPSKGSKSKESKSSSSSKGTKS